MGVGADVVGTFRSVDVEKTVLGTSHILPPQPNGTRYALNEMSQ